MKSQNLLLLNFLDKRFVLFHNNHAARGLDHRTQTFLILNGQMRMTMPEANKGEVYDYWKKVYLKT